MILSTQRYLGKKCTILDRYLYADSLARTRRNPCVKMSKLDDLFDKKKDEAPMLDLSKTVINTAEEYRAVLDKVPEFKTRPEKKTKTPRKEIRAYEKLGTRGYEEKNFTFMDPIPTEMRGLKFEELCVVPIEWRMPTSIRPKSKLDEEYFNRLVELGKSELRTKAGDKREYAKNTMIRKTKNRSGVTETRIVTCSECGEEYCDGKMCAITNYDMFARLKVEVEVKEKRAPAAAGGAGGGKLRRLRRRPRRKMALDFYIDNDMIHIADTKVAHRYGDFFMRKLLKFEELNRKLHHLKI